LHFRGTQTPRKGPIPEFPNKHINGGPTRIKPGTELLFLLLRKNRVSAGPVVGKKRGCRGIDKRRKSRFDMFSVTCRFAIGFIQKH
jgi:hypothetical protein